ncbi:uncharacterized protein N7469_005383 [Penicillium citrinum]|uniref:Uncharacterized protein n=1 Tax=Penicillium citrinum TaxID=5077 RepID=A0A9W9TP93_PENCI|nr:uncharacterized protein N7469_005383 [Penicillium citrinum]KAJ5233617.1 hypothetical protein N7469_005383 [Penicillium citrinum]
MSMGDAISSFLQRSDSTTKNWCTLSSDTVLTNKECPWGAKNQTFKEKGFLPQESHPDILRTMHKTSNMTTSGHALPPTPKRWLHGTSNRIWGMSWFALILYIIMSLLFPTLAVKNELGDEYQDGQPLNEIWQIKGWGAVQSTALLTSYVASFVGSILTSNMLQLVASFLYYCLNDHLTRCLIAADYNSFAVNRAPLRVSFPQGEQRSTFYLTIPYGYAIPLLLVTPYDDSDAAYKPVKWGVVANGPDDSFLHCTFTSQEVKEPKLDVQYA